MNISSLSGLIAAAVLFTGLAHAGTDQKDTSAALTVTGGAYDSANTNCAVELHPTTISIESTLEDLLPQGTKLLPSYIVNVSVSGDSNCYRAFLAGKMLYRFVGVGDEKTGEVLANADTSEGAAAGVGIGIYSIFGDPIALNTGTMSTQSDKFGLRAVSLDREIPVKSGNISSTLTVQLEHL